MRYLIIVVLLFSATVPGRALADTDKVGFRGWGPRGGLTVDPDQIHFGVHTDFGNFAQHIRFQPNFELGFGDNRTIAALNFEGAYRFMSRWNVWTPYLGGGLGVNFTSWDNHKEHHNDSDVDVGLNFLGGIDKGLTSGDRFFMEVKLGFGDSPDFKFTIGWTFYSSLLK